MASSANTLDTLNGLFKEVYAKEIENLIPDGVKLLPRIEFGKNDSVLGGNYHQPIVLGLEHGVTFAASGDDAFNLAAPISGVMKDATVRGTQMVLRAAIGYASVSRSAAGGAKAFKSATKQVVENMLASVTKKLEIMMFHGQMGYGTLAGAPAANVATITTAEFAPGIWAGSENMPLEIRSSGGTLRGYCSVVSTDSSARTITLDSTPAGSTTNDVIWHKGAYGNEFAGIHKILSNTGSLFGIDASQYNLWKGNSYAAAGALSFNKIQLAIAKAVEKGLDSDVVCFVNPGHWADLLNEQAALRMYDSSYSAQKVEQGSYAIKFHGQTGMIEIVSSIYVKEGYAYILSMDEFMRIGSTDITFKRPGKGDEFFRDMENNAGYELRSYSDQALFCFAPGKNVLLTGVTV